VLEWSDQLRFEKGVGAGAVDGCTSSRRGRRNRKKTEPRGESELRGCGVVAACANLATSHALMSAGWTGLPTDPCASGYTQVYLFVLQGV
jgi:hypothetical protein